MASINMMRHKNSVKTPVEKQTMPNKINPQLIVLVDKPYFYVKKDKK